MALGFRDSDALQVAVRAGLVPADALARGARVARVERAIVIEPEKDLAKAVVAKLRGVGVDVEATLPKAAKQVRCWAEALAPVAVGVPALPSLVIFATADKAQTLDLAAELVRLGCDRVELVEGFVRVVDPPTYSVVRALDRDRGLRVFAPDPVGQDATWTELGYQMPLAQHLVAPAGELVLVGTDALRAAPREGWLGLDAALELLVPGDKRVHQPTVLGARRQVKLRLSQGRRDAPSLWVMREGGVAAVDKLLAYLPEDVVQRLTFAVSGKLVVLRARTGRHAPPDLAIAGAEEYALLAGMSDVYAPAGAIVEPPLRRERLRTILATTATDVMWLAREEQGFRVERIADGAFAPLVEWAEYVIHANAPQLQPWLRAATFDFAAYTSTGLEWASAPADGAPVPEDDKKKRRGPKVRSPALQDEKPPEAPKPVVYEAPAPKPSKASEAKSQVEIDAELMRLEQQFIALDAAGDSPERIELLVELGQVYARLGRRRDAGLCFARAVWEAPDPSAILDVWIASDARDPAKALAAALVEKLPSADDVRLVAAMTARKAAPVAADPHKVQRWLDDYDGELDARTLWLSRSGLAQLAGGDQLGLAHARDRILARLAGGLPVERELPAFLRFAGRTGALGNASGEHLGNALDELASRIAKTKRKRTPVEAPPHLTNAYVSFLLAVGFARVGSADRAKALVADAQAALAEPMKEPDGGSGVVHWYLATAYATRVQQALDGASPETPLPHELAAELEKRLAAADDYAAKHPKPGGSAPSKMIRYKIDRLREHSRILEPIERLDAITSFTKPQRDTRGPEFEVLRALTSVADRVRAIDGIVVQAGGADDANKERLLDGAFDLLLELPESGALPTLLKALPMIASLPEPRRAILLAEALVVAGHFGRTELVPRLLAQLSTAMKAVSFPDLERVLQQSLRALRRIGLRRETAELLAEAEKALPPNREDAIRPRLALAAGLAYLGEANRALPIFEQARIQLSGKLLIGAQLDLVRALALAYAQAPLANALAGIADLSTMLKDVSDSFGTNSHFALSVLSFVESLVLGITSDDLALGEAGRRFVEDDEHLIRRRLHRDLGASA